MTAQELGEEIRRDKILAFGYLKQIARATRSQLDAAGFSKMSNAEAIELALKDACDEIEKKIRKWEKQNPDD